VKQGDYVKHNLPTLAEVVVQILRSNKNWPQLTSTDYEGLPPV